MLYLFAFIVAVIGAAGYWLFMYFIYGMWDDHCSKHPDSSWCEDDY